MSQSDNIELTYKELREFLEEVAHAPILVVFSAQSNSFEALQVAERMASEGLPTDYQHF